MDYLKNKKLVQFNDNVKKVFNLLTIQGHYFLIGSSNLRAILYASDYDLMEFVKGQKISVDKIANMFKKKFVEAKKDKDIYITDFKCGLDSNGEPLRWKKEDMSKGFKILHNGQKILLKHCIMQKAMLKMDIIALINGTFTEYSENYYLDVEGDKNYNPEDIDKDNIIKSITNDYKDYAEHGKYYKSLKRLFATLKMQNINDLITEKLVKLFNGQIGLLNKQINEMSIIQIILEQTFRKVNLEDVYNNIQIIKQGLSNVFEIPFKEHIFVELENLTKIKNKKILYKRIERMRLALFDIVNSIAKDFMKNERLI
jgi:hypothetical protein